MLADAAMTAVQSRVNATPPKKIKPGSRHNSPAGQSRKSDASL
jgi:hypothetical protein